LHTLGMMGICLIAEFRGFVVEIPQGLAFQEGSGQIVLCRACRETISGHNELELGLKLKPFFRQTHVSRVFCTLARPE